MKKQNILHSLKQQWIHGQEDNLVPSSLYLKLVAGTSSNIHTKRKEYIFHTLLFWTICLSVIAVIYNISEYFSTGISFDRKTTPYIPTIAILLFTLFFYLSKINRSNFSRYLFVFIVISLACYITLLWGINVPQGLLLFGLSIILSGILISSRASILFIILTTLSLFSIFLLHKYQIITPVISWKQTETNIIDLVIYIGTFTLIAIISWLSNAELERLLSETRHTAKLLEKERNLLEKRVKERTKELEKAYEDLQKVEKEKYVEINKLATLGKLSTGLVHDIVDPLTYISTSLELALWKNNKVTKAVKTNIKMALHGSTQIAKLIESVRTSIRGNTILEKYSLKDVITKTTTLLHYTSKSRKVNITVNTYKDVTLYGNPSDLYQCLTNLLSNAIEAYAKPQPLEKMRKVEIKVNTKGKNIVIFVTDYGVGIEKEKLKYMFDLFYTTKPLKEGTGVGLTMCKEIVEKKLKGTIQCTSTQNSSTTFTLAFPKRQ